LPSPPSRRRLRTPGTARNRCGGPRSWMPNNRPRGNTESVRRHRKGRPGRIPEGRSADRCVVGPLPPVEPERVVDRLLGGRAGVGTIPIAATVAVPGIVAAAAVLPTPTVSTWAVGSLFAAFVERQAQRVDQGLVSLAHAFETVSNQRIFRVAIRVATQGEPPERSPDFLRTRLAGDPQDFVIASTHDFNIHFGFGIPFG
jgi:hypothetical protein